MYKKIETNPPKMGWDGKKRAKSDKMGWLFGDGHYTLHLGLETGGERDARDVRILVDLGCDVFFFGEQVNEKSKWWKWG